MNYCRPISIKNVDLVIIYFSLTVGTLWISNKIKELSREMEGQSVNLQMIFTVELLSKYSCITIHHFSNMHEDVVPVI